MGRESDRPSTSFNPDFILLGRDSYIILQLKEIQRSNLF